MSDDPYGTPVGDRDSGESLAHRVHVVVEELQQRICTALEDLDGRGGFRVDRWDREGGGGGATSVLEGGNVFEKAGVNTSAVHGMLPDRMTSLLGVERRPFFATGISLVIHPWNPYVPSVHANLRYFALGEDLADPDDQWFGGGADLTPYYPFLKDAQHFHRVWMETCKRHKIADYPAFKEQCDRYFFLPHRGEARGVGGIFFDYLRDDIEAGFEFLQDAGGAFLEAYLPIVARRMGMSHGDDERRFQEIRRGRYVEFNLLFDRGTKFGIETEGRTESILMSLPPCVRWPYDWAPEPGSAEARSEWFFRARDWLKLTEDDVP